MRFTHRVPASVRTVKIVYVAMCVQTRLVEGGNKKEETREKKGKSTQHVDTWETRIPRLRSLARYVFLFEMLARFLDFLPQLGIVKYDRGSVSSLRKREVRTVRVFWKIGSWRLRNHRYYGALFYERRTRRSKFLWESFSSMESSAIKIVRVVLTRE